MISKKGKQNFEHYLSIQQEVKPKHVHIMSRILWIFLEALSQIYHEFKVQTKTCAQHHMHHVQMCNIPLYTMP